MENQTAQEYHVTEYHVTYFDAECGRIRSESFESRQDAERFAGRNCFGEESWALIDEVTVEQARIAA